MSEPLNQTEAADGQSLLADGLDVTGKPFAHKIVGIDSSFIHEPGHGAHPIVTVRFAIDDWGSRDAFLRHLRHDG